MGCRSPLALGWVVVGLVACEPAPAGRPGHGPLDGPEPADSGRWPDDAFAQADGSAGGPRRDAQADAQAWSPPKHLDPGAPAKCSAEPLGGFPPFETGAACPGMAERPPADPACAARDPGVLILPAWSGRTWAFAWMEVGAIHLRLADSTGACRSARLPVPREAILNGPPRLLWTGRAFDILWCFPDEVWLATVGEDGAVLRAPVPLAVPCDFDVEPAAVGDALFLATLMPPVGSDEAWRHQGILTRLGSSRAIEQMQITTARGGWHFANAGGVLALLQSPYDRPRVELSTLEPDFRVRTGPVVLAEQVGFDGPTPIASGLAWSGSELWATWWWNWTERAQIARLDLDGSPLAAAIELPGIRARDPALAVHGGRAAVVWQDGDWLPGYCWDTFSWALLDESGSLLAGPRVLAAQVWTRSGGQGVRADGESFVLGATAGLWQVWGPSSDFQTRCIAPYALRVDRLGQPLRGWVAPTGP